MSCKATKRRVDALLGGIRDVAAVSFVGSTRRLPRPFTARGRAPWASVCRPLGGAKNHMVVLPDADPRFRWSDGGDWLLLRRLPAERCMAVSVVIAVGSAADALVARLEASCTGAARGAMDRTRPAKMGPLDHPVPTGPRSRALRAVRRGAGRASWWSMARGPGRAGARAGVFSWGHGLFDQVSPRDADLSGGDFRAGAVGRCAFRTWLQPLETGQRRTSTATGAALFHARRRAQRSCLHPPRAGGDGRHQRADPGADGFLLFVRGAGSEACSARRHAVRDGSGALLHPLQGP